MYLTKSPIFCSFIIILLAFLNQARCLNTSSSTRHGTLAIYWGQFGNEDNLNNTCATKRYKYVNLAYLNVFGQGRLTSLNLAGSCNPRFGGCAYLSSQIEFCQSLGVKILLSIGGDFGNYSVASSDDAKNFGRYLFNNFLGGESSSRPLGKAILDGIDFSIRFGSPLYWDVLAKSLHKYSNKARKVYLTAAPQCKVPDKFLGTALKTGIFDYVWPQFYNNIDCQFYNDNITNLVSSWTLWSSQRYVKKLFMGLPSGFSRNGGGGFVPPNVLTSQVLPIIKRLDKYGGVMLSSRFWDVQNDYSRQIFKFVWNIKS